MKVLESDGFVFQANLCQRRNHALFDFSSGPPLRNFLQPVKLKRARINSPLFQMNPEHFNPFVFGRKVDEKHLVETSLADHLCREQINTVGGSGNKQSARLFLHPGQEKRKNASHVGSAFSDISRKPHFNFVKPDDGRRNRFDRAARFHESGIGIAVAPRIDLAHFDPVERKAEA